MDSGFVIPGLNEEWTLLGAKLNEWICGVAAFLLAGVTIVPKISTSMPLLLIVLFATAMGLGAARRSFPDETKGLRNFCFMLVGAHPPGIPAPSSMQPVWSGTPSAELSEKHEFVQLGLDQIFKTEPEVEN